MLDALCTGCVFNNSSRVFVERGRFKKLGSPTEAALKVFAEKVAGNATSSSSAFNYEKKMKGKVDVIVELDFTSERKTMSSIVTGYKNEKDMLLKGAPDRIL